MQNWNFLQEMSPLLVFSLIIFSKLTFWRILAEHDPSSFAALHRPVADPGISKRGGAVPAR